MMKTKTDLKKGTCRARSPFTLVTRSIIVSALILTSFQVPLQAQETFKYTQPSWWFGAAAGANLNFYRGTTQELNSELTVPGAFHHGFGAGLYLAPLLEFHRPDSRWGFMLQGGFDNRKGSFEETASPCNCPEDLDAKLSYITIEPSLRIAPFKSNFYLYVGPRFAFNLAKSFTYQMGINPAYPDQEPQAEVTGDFSSVNKRIISMQVGAGYDIALSSQNKHTQWMLSPFISFQPYFGQDPRSIETWTLTTVRLGAAIKFGRGKLIEKPAEPVVPVVVPVVVVDPEVKFTINSPANIPVERRVRETFPILNYVFFDVGSTEISDRYVLLKKDQVKDFKEDRLEVFTPKRLPGRAAREMVVYYNVINILGDRMVRFPLANVRLTGATLEGFKDGKEMAETIKNYLVSVFGIDPKRIITEGRLKPRLASEELSGTRELELLREEDNRVSIWSDSPEILMEYQTGPNVPLKPIDISIVQDAPLESYVTFNVDNGEKALTSWSLDIQDDKGKVQKFGPYTGDNRSISGKAILGTLPEGNFKATMIGKTKSGKTIKKEASFKMKLWTPTVREEGMRYSVIYEFNETAVTETYVKYLTEIVTPKIPSNGKVILSGYTDVIGDAANNKDLSLSRANDVKKIIADALAVKGRNDVTFVVFGFGEDDDFSPFENGFPEERFYNRCVVIDIIPQ